MPIDASTDPYDGHQGFDPAGAKFDRPDLAKEFDDDADARGVATSKVDRSAIDEDLSRAGTGAARGAAIDVDDVEKQVPGDLGAKVDFAADDDVDLDAAGSGSGLKGALLAGDDLGGEVDDASGAGRDLDGVDDFDDFDKGAGLKTEGLDLDDGTDGDDSLKGAIDDDFDKFDDHDHGDHDHGDHDHGDKDFLGFH